MLVDQVPPRTANKLFKKYLGAIASHRPTLHAPPRVFSGQVVTVDLIEHRLSLQNFSIVFSDGKEETARHLENREGCGRGAK